MFFKFYSTSARNIFSPGYYCACNEDYLLILIIFKILKLDLFLHIVNLLEVMNALITINKLVNVCRY